jgi:cytochrome b561
MRLLGTEIRYGSVAQTFHWLTAILVLSAWLVAEGDRSPTIALHETLGLAVFVLVSARLLWRAFDRQPEQPMAAAMAWASRAVHWLLYGLLFAIPASAIIGTQLEGHPLTIYGLGSLGPYLSVSRRIGHQILEVHQTMGTMIIWVAGLHAAAAIFHHFFLRDGVLRAMLPGRSA